MKNEIQKNTNDEISLSDIVNILKNNLKLVVFFSLVGLFIALVNIVLTPKKYEARWQLQMAQFQSNSNIEEPASLIQRLRTPTVYPLWVQQTCGMPENGEFGDYLGGMLKIAVVKNVANVVEMTVSGPSSGRAKECAEAIVAMVVAQQHSQIEERLAGRQAQIDKYNQALLEEQRQLEKIKSPELSNFGYLAKLDKMSWLRTRIDALHEETMLSQLHPAKLIAPIYLPSKPVPRKSGLTLLLGISLGLLFGGLYAFGREVWRKMA